MHQDKGLARRVFFSFLYGMIDSSCFEQNKAKECLLKEKTRWKQKKSYKYCNYCVSLLSRNKRKYYNSLDEKNVTDNNKLCRTVKLFLLYMTPFNAKIALIEDGEIISSNNKIAVFWTLFSLIL